MFLLLLNQNICGFQVTGSIGNTSQQGINSEKLTDIRYSLAWEQFTSNYWMKGLVQNARHKRNMKEV